MRKLFGNESTRTAALQINYGEILTELGRFDDARTNLDHALAIFRAQKADSYFIGYALLDLGRLALARGDATKARATLTEAAATLGTAHQQLAPELDFALARAFWTVPADRPKALRLARQARERIGEPGRRRKLAEIEAWLAGRE
jgi:tetratricopeptide (TPR) repeat protein